MLRLANVEDWQMSKDENSKRLRDAAYVIPPNASSDSDSDSEMSVPFAKLAKKYRREREIIQTRIPRKASSHLLAQKSQEPQSECGY